MERRGMTEPSPPFHRRDGDNVLRDAALDPSAYLAAVGILLFFLAAYGNWSSQNTLKQAEIPIGSNTVQIASSDGMFMVGVFEAPNESQPLIWWSRRNAQPDLGGSLARNSEDPVAFAVTPLGWGLGVRYLIIMIGGASMPLWWWFVQRGRWERQRRIRDGLCRGCGYDVRMSPIHCPECGRYVGRIATADLVTLVPSPSGRGLG